MDAEKQKGQAFYMRQGFGRQVTYTLEISRYRMSTHRLGTIELPPVIQKPRKKFRYPKISEDGDESSRCPYCLETLAALAEPSPKRHCPICQHGIPITILGTAPHCLNRAQKWDLLANEMEYIWDWEHCDVSSYLDNFSGYWNPDYSEAKDRLVLLLIAKAAVLRLRKEFLEAEGELDLLIIGYLSKFKGGDGRLGSSLRWGRKWRGQAVDLSAFGAGPREIAEFQLDMVRHLSWAVFQSLERKERAIRFLLDRLEKEDGGIP